MSNSGRSKWKLTEEWFEFELTLQCTAHTVWQHDVDDTMTRNSDQSKAWPPNTRGAQAEGTSQQLIPHTRKVKESLLWPGTSQWRIYYHRMWSQLSTTFSNALKQQTGELLVAVNHNQLRTMASETVDPIDWSHPPPSWAVPPERLVHSINAYAATQGMSGREQYWRIVRTNA